MSQHVIVGAGPVNSATAVQLTERGESVAMVTRSGSGPAHAGIQLIAADATDPDKLTALTKGADALYNCANPQYHRWLTDWPPLASSLLTAAERSGAVLVTAAPLYGYGPGSGVMGPDTPLAATHPKLRMRADMWREALRRHRDGRIRATEVRGSDYIEGNGILSWSLGAPLLAGKRAYAPVPINVPHTWTSIHDVARTLVTVSGDERAYGKAWMVPSHEPLTVAQFAAEFAEANGLARPKVSHLPYVALWTAGLFDPMVKELRTTHYQFAKPFLVDASATEATFGIKARPLDESMREAAANVRAAEAAKAAEPKK